MPPCRCSVVSLERLEAALCSFCTWDKPVPACGDLPWLSVRVLAGPAGLREDSRFPRDVRTDTHVYFSRSRDSGLLGPPCGGHVACTHSPPWSFSPCLSRSPRAQTLPGTLLGSRAGGGGQGARGRALLASDTGELSAPGSHLCGRGPSLAGFLCAHELVPDRQLTSGPAHSERSVTIH